MNVGYSTFYNPLFHELSPYLYSDGSILTMNISSGSRGLHSGSRVVGELWLCTLYTEPISEGCRSRGSPQLQDSVRLLALSRAILFSRATESRNLL